MERPCSARADEETIGQLVLGILSQRDKLRPEAAQLQVLPVKQGGEERGLYFIVRGPRQMMLTAIWDYERQVIWCYDSRGERFHTESIPRSTLAA